MEGLYPLCLYRAGGQFQWDGRPTDTLIVADESGHFKALDDGWQEAPDYWAALLDADHDGKMGGSRDGFDQMTDEELRAEIEAMGVSVHHRTGRPKMLEILRNSAGERLAS